MRSKFFAALLSAAQLKKLQLKEPFWETLRPLHLPSEYSQSPPAAVTGPLPWGDVSWISFLRGRRASEKSHYREMMNWWLMYTPPTEEQKIKITGQKLWPTRATSVHFVL